MATSSIFQTVVVKNQRQINRLADALEKSKATPAKDVAYSRTVELIEDADTIRKMFGERTGTYSFK